MTPQAVAPLETGHGLPACRTHGTASTKMQDRFAPVSQSLLDENIDRIDFHPLRAPAKRAIGRRITTPDNVDPEGLFRRRFEKIHIDAKPVLLRALTHLVHCSFDHFDDGGNLYARVSANNRDRLRTLVGRHG